MEKKYFLFATEGDDSILMFSDFNDMSNGISTYAPGAVRKACKLLGRLGLEELRIIKLYIHNELRKCISETVKKKWTTDEGIRFIICSRCLESFGLTLVQFLKENYRECKVVVYFPDLLDRHKINNFETIRKQCDLTVTFDTAEARKYDFRWCIEPFSKNYLRTITCDKEKKWDVTYVGHAKNRYDKIMDLYNALKKHGLKCDFHITGVSQKKRIDADDIGYEPLPFVEVIEHVMQSRCVADIPQQGAEFPTTRYSEAMFFDCNLITNASYFKDMNDIPKNVFYFEDLNDIDFNSITQYRGKPEQRLIDELSIESFIKNIEEGLVSEK